MDRHLMAHRMTTLKWKEMSRKAETEVVSVISFHDGTAYLGIMMSKTGSR